MASLTMVEQHCLRHEIDLLRKNKTKQNKTTQHYTINNFLFCKGLFDPAAFRFYTLLCLQFPALDPTSFPLTFQTQILCISLPVSYPAKTYVIIVEQVTKQDVHLAR